MKRKNDAFTLIEILVVVILVGIMAAIIVPQFTDASDDAEASRDDMNRAIIQNAVDYYEYQNGSYPADVATLVTGNYLRAAPEGTWAINGTTGAVTGP
jgi:type II secretion system protein G